ncbi:U4/U6.U5 snRNP associated protein [Savitreella phatthalungensis]
MSEDRGSRISRDTDFRRKWDKATYAEQAADRAERERAEGKARYEARLRGVHYRAPVPAPAEDDDRSGKGERKARAAQDFTEVVGKNILVPAGASLGRRGKGAGFYCSACDETYKDNSAWLDHINSKAHLYRTGGGGKTQEVTLEVCLRHLERLKRKYFAKQQAEASRGSKERGEGGSGIGEYSIREALDARKREAENQAEARAREKEAKKRRKQEKKEEEEGDSGLEIQVDDEEGQKTQEMLMASMGFRGFV